MWPSRDSTTNPFIGGSGINGSGNRNPFISKNSNKNCFNQAPAAAAAAAVPAAAAAAVVGRHLSDKEEFPSLMSRAAVKAKAESAQTSYKDLLVSTIDHRMVEEQTKMRSAQAAELERVYKHYNKRAIAEARAAHAASASASASAASTELELLYDEDGRERS